MSVSLNDLYPRVYDLADMERNGEKVSSVSSLADSLQSTASNAFDTILCSYDNTATTDNQEDYISSKHYFGRMAAPAWGRHTKQLLVGNHRKQNHHGTPSPGNTSNSSMESKSLQTATKQVVFVEAVTSQKFRQLEDDYVLTQQIVRCKVATIWECIHRKTGGRYCVKAIDKRRFKTKIDEDTALREVSMYRSLFSKNRTIIPSIPKLYDLLKDKHHFYIVQEYEAGGGNLGMLLRDNGPLSELQMNVLTRLLLEAVSGLHCQSICHNDLHPENVLIRGVGSLNEVLASSVADSRSIIKLCDFGRALCVVHESNENLPGRVRTMALSHIRHSSLYYTSPEVLMGNSPGLSSDMWSIGVILYVCFSGQLPFHMDPQQSSTTQRGLLKQQICQADYTFPAENPHWPLVSRSAKQFVSSLLHPDPVVRMNCQEALSHPWLSLSVVLGQALQSTPKSTMRRKQSGASSIQRHVQLPQDKLQPHPLNTDAASTTSTASSKKSKTLVHRLWGKMKLKHRATKSENDLNIAASTLPSLNSAASVVSGAGPGIPGSTIMTPLGHKSRRHKSM